MLLVERIIPSRNYGALSSNTQALASGARCPAYGVVEHSPHCAPLERGNFGVSHSIHMSIRWIEEFDADKSWVLLVERIIPPRDNGALSSNTQALASGARCPAYGVVEHSPHCAPLERGNLDASYSIHMSIRWIEEFDADKS